MEDTFIGFPAIDLRNGSVVRLVEGDKERQTAYSDNAGATAERWLSAGARWLHVVNLDGAFEEKDDANRTSLVEIMRVAKKYGAKVQMGGGLRTAAMVAQALGMGVDRAILGTLAIREPEVLTDLTAHWGSERIGASLDARDGKVQVRGWQEATVLSAVEAAQRMKEAGVEWLVFTDIARDGLQRGINLNATAELARASGLRVIASGGVRGAEDIRQACQAGLAGIIAGRALYEETLKIEELLQECKPANKSNERIRPRF